MGKFLIISFFFFPINIKLKAHTTSFLSPEERKIEEILKLNDITISKFMVK